MSRNSKRAPQGPNPGATQGMPPGSNTQQNPFGMSFVVSTETVPLPSRGKYYPSDSPLHNVEEVQIKHLTAKEEDILGNEENIARGDVFDILIDNIMVDKRIKSRDLLEGDKTAILVASRITGYGSEYKIEDHCGNCKKRNEFTFDLEKCLEHKERELPSGVREENGIFRFNIKSKDLEVGIRVLNGADDAYLQEQKKRRLELNIPGSDTVDFLNMVVEDVNKVTDKASLNQLFEVLPISDVRKIKTTYSKIVPSADLVQEVECAGCGHKSERQVPFSVGFFWPELRVS